MIFGNLIYNAEGYLKEISLLSYIAVFAGGILSSLTPCIYPLIPITISYIGARSAQTKAKAFIISLSYVLGIAFTYSCLGAIAALGGGVFGEISANPWTYLFVGNVFLLLGLSMLDIFVLSIPSFLKAKETAKKKEGLLGVFLVGASAGLIASPCTAPVLGALLTYVASRQSLFFGITLLFTFAVGMGSILIIVGTSVGLAASLPKSGRWMNIIKKIFAFFLIACAEYFIILAGRRLV